MYITDERVCTPSVTGSLAQYNVFILTALSNNYVYWFMR